MSYRVSSFACAITLFVAFLAAFASASPASIARGELGVVRRNNEVEDVPSQVHTGKATWHYQTGLAACGGDFKDSDYGVALSPANFGDKSTCGKQVKITNTQTEQSTVVTVRDECPGCSGWDVDLTLDAFKALGDVNFGAINVVLEFN